jgi:predicted ATPase/class 3 adenylate cyclase
MRAELPTGTVTFLFTDVEGSTSLLYELGPQAYEGALGAHRVALRDVFAAHNGVEVDTQGDAFFVAFARAADAVAAAGELGERHDSGPMHARAGVHTGEPLLTRQGYVGVDVHRAARIAAAGHGGQVLVSQTTRDLVPDAHLVDLGEHRLKDLTRGERLYQLGEGEFPPLKSLNRTNLPLAAGPLLGRGEELELIGRLVAEKHRLVTLVGPGGSGKTRLGLQVAAELVDEYPDGVFFVGLAAVNDAAYVAATVSAAMGFSPDDDPVALLRDKRALLVLDNAEHLELAPIVGELVDAAREVNVIVTSRAPLHLSLEQLVQVEPLEQSAAVELFLSRAGSLGVEVELDDTVTEICRRLDCLPLAVELAAARTRVLSTSALLERLEQAFPLLTGGPSDAPERQRTLHATIDWSYRLLAESARRQFRSLAVFEGTFSADAAEQVADADLDALAELVDQSLVKHVADDRYLLLETIREFALAQLEPDEVAGLRREHALHFAALAEREGALLDAGDQRAGLHALERDLPNLRAAFDYLAEQGDAEAFAKAVSASWRFWGDAGRFREGAHHARLALRLGDELPPETRLQLLRNAFWSQAMGGDWDEALPLGHERVALARAHGDQNELAAALMSEGYAFQIEGDLDAALAVGLESVQVARQAERADTVAAALENLATTQHFRREFDDAAASLAEALPTWRAANDEVRVAHVMGNLAQVHLMAGDNDAAEACLREALPILAESHRYEFAWALANAANLAWRRGDALRAARLLGCAEALHRDMISRLPPFTAQMHLEETADLRASRTRPDVEAAWRAGAAMTTEDALVFALGPPDAGDGGQT